MIKKGEFSVGVWFMKTKKYLALLLTAVIAILMLSSGNIGLALGYKIGIDDVTLDITPTPLQVDKVGDTATMQLTIRNAQVAFDMMEVTVLAGDGTLLKSIPVITADSSTTLNINRIIDNPGTNIEFTVKWLANNIAYEKKISVMTQLKVLLKKLSFERTVNKVSLDLGQEFILTYTVKNIGEAKVTDIKVSDGLLASFQTFTLASGKEKMLTKKIKIVQDTISKPKLEALNLLYELAGITIKVSRPKIGIDLTSDTATVKRGESVVLTCVLKNLGNVDFKNLKVKDDKLVIIKSVSSLGAGKSMTITRKVTIEGNEKFIFHVTAYNADNRLFTIDSAPLEIIVSDVVPPQESTQLSIKATSDVTKLASAGKITFDIVVTNNGPTALSNIEISELALGSIGKMDRLEPGDKLFQKSVDISKTGSYTFKVTANDPDGNVIEMSSTAIDITVGSTPAPSSTTVAPTPTANTDQSGKSSALFAILGVIAFLIIAAAITLIILIVQERKNNPGKHVKKKV